MAKFKEVICIIMSVYSLNFIFSSLCNENFCCSSTSRTDRNNSNQWTYLQSIELFIIDQNLPTERRALVYGLPPLLLF